MKNTIAAIALTLATGSVAADGFAPWEDRLVSDAPSDVERAITTPSGFAPWREIMTVPDVIDSSVQIGDIEQSAFRPWS